jgi:aspartyl/glutamyl-tRNA(Asn/Gln) amidotransferase C subunit
LADLARLRLGDDESEGLTDDCRTILDYFAAIRGLDVAGVQQIEEREPPAPLRADEVACDPLERPLAELAPDWREGFFVLPRLPAMDIDPAEGGGEGGA